MRTRRVVILAVLVVAGLAAGGWWLSRDGDDAPWLVRVQGLDPWGTASTRDPARGIDTDSAAAGLPRDVPRGWSFPILPAGAGRRDALDRYLDAASRAETGSRQALWEQSLVLQTCWHDTVGEARLDERLAGIRALEAAGRLTPEARRIDAARLRTCAGLVDHLGWSSGRMADSEEARFATWLGTLMAARNAGHPVALLRMALDPPGGIGAQRDQVQYLRPLVIDALRTGDAQALQLATAWVSQVDPDPYQRHATALELLQCRLQPWACDRGLTEALRNRVPPYAWTEVKDLADRFELAWQVDRAALLPAG
jgi:hypothetical protein